MEIDSIPTNAETEQIDSFDTTRPLELVPEVSTSAPALLLEEGQIPPSRDSSPQPPSENGVAKLDKGKAKAVEDDWATSRQVTTVITDDQDRRDDWDKVASPTASHATTITTENTTNVAWVKSVQDPPQPPQSVTEKSSSKGWGSWGTNDGWGSPVPAGGVANDGWGSPVPAKRAADEWGAAPQSTTATGNTVTTAATTASTSTWGGTSGWNQKTTNRVRFEDRSEGGFESGGGRGRGRGRGRDRDWSGLGGFGKRDYPSSRDQPPTKSFNRPSTSSSNPDSGWGARTGRNNRTDETSPTRIYQQEQSTQSAWGTNVPIYQTQTPTEPHAYHYPLGPAPFQPPAPPVTTRPVLWPLHTDLTLKREFGYHAKKLAKYQVRLTGVENKQQGVLDWYSSRAKDLSGFHADDRETLERELSKTRLKRDNNLAVLKVDEKMYAGLVEAEWALLVRTLRDEMARVLENAIHELLWKMTAVAGDGRGGFDINRALEEVMKTAMPSIIEGQLQRYVGTIMKAAEKESRKVQVATPVEDHPMNEQSDTGQASSTDLQAVLDRLSAIEQENADLKASNIKLQEAIHQLEAKTQEGISSVRKEAMGWTLEGQDHPVARQIREKFQTEREFILEGITSNLQLVFGAVLDRHSPDV